MHFFERPKIEDALLRVQRKEKSPALGGIRTQNLSIMKPALYGCATTAAQRPIVGADMVTKLSAILMHQPSRTNSDKPNWGIISKQIVDRTQPCALNLRNFWPAGKVDQIKSFGNLRSRKQKLLLRPNFSN